MSISRNRYEETLRANREFLDYPEPVASRSRQEIIRNLPRARDIQIDKGWGAKGMARACDELLAELEAMSEADVLAVYSSRTDALSLGVSLKDRFQANRRAQQETK